ncbi:hypothetical protein B0H16DRAFT_1765265 [Mycena metata]|uniref:Uncharacterized protein n=1 Tax=Mycena metata TaxID=1033252 RepID=A0AAD7MVW4_9AGAR|nr:hypothetical protein B0H16DRAFT_1765265 [Mycena metata]
MAGCKQSSFTTNHFEKGALKPGRSNRRYWKCKYCGDDENNPGAKLEGSDNVLPNHIADSRQCPNAPGTARNEALRFIEAKKSTSDATSDKNQDEPDSVIDVDAEAGPSTASSSKAGASGAVVVSRKRKFQGSLDSFVDTAMSTAQKNSADRKLLRFIIHADIAFASVDDPYLDEFCHDLRPSYDSPGRFALTHTLLDAEAAHTFLCEADRLQSSKFLTFLEDG